MRPANDNLAKNVPVNKFFYNRFRSSDLIVTAPNSLALKRGAILKMDFLTFYGEVNRNDRTKEPHTFKRGVEGQASLNDVTLYRIPSVIAVSSLTQ